jgi:L-arabinose isomerase
MTGAPAVWFVTGSQHLYGEQTLAQVATQSAQVCAMINAADAVSAPVLARPVVVDAASIRATLAAADADPDCVGVIAWMHTFSPAKMWIGGLRSLRKPLLHLHTQLNESLPWASLDMDFMNLNQSAHGDREFGYLQARLRLAHKTVVGHVADPGVQRRIDAWIRAAIAREHLDTLRVARFGDNMRGVAVTEGDKVEVEHRLGTAVDGYGVGDLVAVVDAVAESTVDALVDQYARDYTLAPVLAAGAARHDSLRYAARIEAGLRQFLEEGGFGAFTTNFEDLGGLRQLPGLAVQRLMADGYGFGAEGDWKTAILLAALKAAGRGTGRGTSFMEDYTYHFGPGTAKVLGAHMLEVCPSIAAARPSCQIHPLSIGDREDPVRLVFDAAAGPATVVGLVDMGDRLRLVANVVDVVPPDEPLPRLPVARAVWEPKPSLAESAECWLMAGGPHHTVLSQAVDVETVADLARMLELELLVIDADTVPAAFADRIRWNYAYHRLAGGVG